MRVWRICRERHLSTALSGEGAARGGARWNPPGTPIAYTSEHLSLAVVELFVHITEDEAPDDLVAISAEIPVTPADIEAQKKRVLAQLAADWKEVNNRQTRALGQAWVDSGESAVLFVPSAVIDGEWNILINPVHPEASTIKIIDARPYHFDSRMFRTRQRA